ncbi:MAG: PLP-dependent transferase [Fimbriimonadaceae bacterium]|nr:PLP-dependent transferase [Fimbriimonadaceae bacterium]
MNLETLTVHAGFEQDEATGAVMPPIYQVSTFAQRAPGEHQGYEYSRSDNPTRTPLQTAIAELEHAKHGLVFSSGLAAIDAVLNTLKAGDHVVACDDLYGGTARLFNQVAANRGLTFTLTPPLKTGEGLTAAMTANTKLVWIESPTNPMLNVLDISAVAEAAHAHGALLAVDNTFLSPALQNPLRLGADIVMHSATKYINGHSDVIMGALAVNDDALYERLKFLQNAMGAVPSPIDCFLVMRGIRTLALRVAQHDRNGRALSAYLAQHPNVEAVIYPGLISHPGHALAVKQQRGFGGMLCFYLRGDLDATRKFLSHLHLFKIAESLGGVESLIEHPAIMTHASVPEERRRQLGILDNFVRISCGIEHPDDLIADLERALASR